MPGLVLMMISLIMICVREAPRGYGFWYNHAMMLIAECCRPGY